MYLNRKDDGGIDIEAEQVNMQDLAEFAGFLLGMTGWEAYKRGMEVEAVKGNLLELYMAAVELVEEWIRKEGESDGEKEKADPGREKAER